MKRNETVLITGATSGIGLELARLFAKDGYDLVILSRHRSELVAVAEELAKSYKVIVIPIEKDLFETYAAFEVFDEIKAKGIRIDILINNAGHGYYGEFSDSDLKKDLDIIQLNICALVTLTKLYLDEMIARGRGKILNTSSIAGKTPGPWQAIYFATKAFVQSFTEAVRFEVKDKGITITALLPGVTDTEFFDKAGMDDSKAVQDKSKMSDPADVAKDGYEALMAGKDMVISGFKNKLFVVANSLSTDAMNARNAAKRNEPVDGK